MSNLLKQVSGKPIESSEIKESNTGYKQYTDPFNPFNSWKVMFHVERMKQILFWLDEEAEQLPPPVYVTVDPSDVCNHACFFCISAAIQESDNTTLKRDILISLSEVIYKWKSQIRGIDFNILSVVNAGGGEPLINSATKDFLLDLSKNRLQGGPEFSIISNGELLTEEVSRILAKSATWAGFSIDSGNTEDHKKMHIPKKKGVDNFSKVIENVRNLCKIRDEYKSERKTLLNIGYKFNIHPDSFTSMVEAARLAKDIGTDQIQFKPTHVDNAVEVMVPIIEQSQNNIMKARELYEDENFKVQGSIHKFGPSWEPNHDFGLCTMTPLGAIFSADGNLYLCCDRRGDPTLSLGKWHDGKKARLDMIQEMWGSKKHRNMIKDIKTSQCPRCTMYFSNKVVSEAFVKDKMNKSFL